MVEIWKFALSAGQRGIVAPAGATFLTVQIQRGIPCVWAYVDPSQPVIEYPVEIAATGKRVDLTGKQYIGTFQLVEEQLVFHVFIDPRTNWIPSP